MGPEIFLATLELILLHKLDGTITFVNPMAVVQLAQPKPTGAPHKQFTDAVQCIITLTDDTYVTVKESCDTVRGLFTHANENEYRR